MIKILEIETDKYIIVSEKRIKELVRLIYDIISNQSPITEDEYKNLIDELNEFLRVYERKPNSKEFLKEIAILKQMLSLYAKDTGVI